MNCAYAQDRYVQIKHLGVGLQILGINGLNCVREITSVGSYASTTRQDDASRIVHAASIRFLLRELRYLAAEVSGKTISL